MRRYGLMGPWVDGVGGFRRCGWWIGHRYAVQQGQKGRNARKGEVLVGIPDLQKKPGSQRSGIDKEFTNWFPGPCAKFGISPDRRLLG